MSLASSISTSHDEVMGESSNEQSKGPSARLLLSALQSANESTSKVRIRPEVELKELGSGSQKKKRYVRKNRGNNDNHQNGNTGKGGRRNKSRNGSNNDNDNETKVFRGKRTREDQNEKQLTITLSEETNENATKKVKKERCTFWPNCTKGDECPFVHPSETCKNFPACTFGDKCLFLHPSVPCKFGAACTRPNCAFHHPPRPVQVPIPCKFGNFCTKGAACPFTHSHISSRWNHVATNDTVTTTACKFGDSCRYKDTTCKFVHPNTGKTEGEVAQLSSTLPSTPPQDSLIDEDNSEYATNGDEGEDDLVDI